MAIKDLKNVKQVACYLTPDQHTSLKKMSAATGAPIAHYLRLAVSEYLERQAKRSKS